MRRDKTTETDMTTIEEVLLEHSGFDLSDALYLRELEQRKLYLTEEVNAYEVGDAIKVIHQYNKEDRCIAPAEREPIRLYICSPGGAVDDGFALIDAILCSKTPVYTVNLGYAYSMGFLIMLAGHRRYAMPNAKFLIHDGMSLICNTGTKARDEMDFNRQVEQRIKRYTLARSKITEEEYDSKERVEWYMFADEAKARGIIEYVIGEDAGLDEIV